MGQKSFGVQGAARRTFPSFNGSALSRFIGDENASIATTFALSAVAMIGLIATSLEYSRSLQLQASIQAAADGAVLAAANSTANLNASVTYATGSGDDNSTATATGREAVARNFFNSSIGKSASLIKSLSFKYDSTAGTVTANVTASQPLTIGGRWGASINLHVASTSAVKSAPVRALDVVMCIDATGSMTPTLSAVQTNALNFKANLDAALAALGVPTFDQMRTRVIYYRDYGGYGVYNYLWPYYYNFTGTALGDSTVMTSGGFYNLPADVNTFNSFVYTQTAWGGGDLPESGLECLNEAMHSSWTKVGDTLSNGKTAQLVFPAIAIFTDAGAHPPSFSYSLQNPSYPASSYMPRDYAGLLANWNSSSIIDQTNKMILFYGNPDIQDDYYFGNTSGWSTVKTWNGFQNPGSLTSANTSFVSSLATGIARGVNTPQLTH